MRGAERAARAAFSAYGWAVMGVFALLGLPLIALTLALLPRGHVFRFGGLLFRLCLGLLGVRVRLHGAANLDPSRHYIVMGNHVSFLDPFLLATVFPFPVVALEKRENFRIPIYGWFMRRWGNIPIDRNDRHQAVRDLEAARRFVGGKSDRWVLVMPEGTRTRNGRLGRFKKGGFHLAQAAGTPIAPYSLRGAYDVQHTGSWLLAPGLVEVELHQPIDPAAFGSAGLDDLMAAVRRAIAGGLPGEEAEIQPERPRVEVLGAWS